MAGKKKYGISSNFPETILLKRHFLFVNDMQNSGNSSAPSFTNISRRVLTAIWSVSSLTLKSSSNKPGPLNNLLLNRWFMTSYTNLFLTFSIYSFRKSYKKEDHHVNTCIDFYCILNETLIAAPVLGSPCKWFYE